MDARDVTAQAAQARAAALAAEKALGQARAAQQAAEADHRLAMAWQTRIASLVFGKGSPNETSRVAIKAGLGPGELVRSNLPDMGNVTRAALMNFSASPWGLF